MDGDKIFQILEQECKPFLETIKDCHKGYFLLRGYFYEIKNIKKFNHDLDNRKPRNMSIDDHNRINDYFQPIFNWKIRNGIFCYGFDILNNKPIDLGYGIFYLFFPIGEFSYVYSPDHFDLWGSKSLTKKNIDEFIKSLNFKDNDFCEVMNFRKEFDEFGNEVSVRAKSYYLVNTLFAEEIASKIWG
jgi:hypothetical protein